MAHNKNTLHKNQLKRDQLNKDRLITRSFLLLVVFILIFIRFFYLDADPSFFKRVGDIADEGYWTHNARTAVLFDNWTTDDMTQSLFLSPLYSFLVYGSFKIGGVSLYSARMVSVFFSLLTLLFLYLLVKAEFGKTAAYGAVVMLGFNQWFLIYNKMALVETTLTFFLLMSLLCWHFQGRSGWYSLGSGIFFSLAVLTKVTAIYFLPVFVLLIIFDILKHRLNFKKLSIFAGSTVVLLSAYFYFIFLPNWLKYKKHFLNLMLFDHKNALEILASPFHLLSNNFFGDISIFLLFTLFLIYALNTVPTFLQRPFLDALRSLKDIEALALSWILGGTAGLFFSNMHDRRFFIFIIPLIILSISLLVKGRGFSIKNSIQNLSAEIYQRIATRPGAFFLFSLFLFFPVISLAYFGVESYFRFNYSNPAVNLGSLLAYLGLAIIFHFWLASKINKVNKGRESFLPPSQGRGQEHREYQKHQEWAKLLFLRLMLGALLLTLLLPAITVGRTFLHNVLIALGNTLYEPMLVAMMAALLLFFSLLGIFYLEKKDFSPGLTRHLFLTYLFLNIIFIGIMFLFPSFTVRDTSREIGLYVPHGEVIVGSFANLLAIENKALPFLYAPYDKDYAFMNNETKKRQAFLLISTKYDGNSNDPEQELSKYGHQKVTFIREFNLYRYPNKAYKNQIRLYRIDVS